MHLQLWELLSQIKYAEYFCQRIYNCISFGDRFLNGFAVCLSGASIFSWILSSKFPIGWSIILGITTLIQTTKRFFPFFRHLASFKFYIPALRRLSVEIENEWNTQFKLSQSEYPKRLAKLKEEYLNLDLQYFGEYQLPNWKWLSSRAWYDCKECLEQFAYSIKVDEKSVGQTDAPQTR